MEDTTDQELLASVKRECGNCHKCCEGWLTGFSYGFEFNQGRPCQFLSHERHCTIYDRRPYDPCQAYRCEWLANPLVPEWMKPNHSNVIVTGRQLKEHVYWDLIECGEKLDSSILSWFFLFCLNNQINLVYRINGSINYLATPQFVEDYKEAYEGVLKTSTVDQTAKE
jgi:hypothetical protein